MYWWIVSGLMLGILKMIEERTTNCLEDDLYRCLRKQFDFRMYLNIINGFQQYLHPVTRGVTAVILRDQIEEAIR